MRIAYVQIFVFPRHAIPWVRQSLIVHDIRIGLDPRVCDGAAHQICKVAVPLAEGEGVGWEWARNYGAMRLVANLLDGSDIKEH